MAEGQESVRSGLNAIGNPEQQIRSSEGGMTGTGRLGQVRPTGILSRGERDSVAQGRGGLPAGREKLRSASR